MARTRSLVRRGVGPRREGGLVDLRLVFLGDPGGSCGGGAVEGHGAEVPGKFIKSNRFVAFETTEKPCLCDCRKHTFYMLQPGVPLPDDSEWVVDIAAGCLSSRCPESRRTPWLPPRCLGRRRPTLQLRQLPPWQPSQLPPPSWSFWASCGG